MILQEIHIHEVKGVELLKRGKEKKNDRVDTNDIVTSSE